MMLEKQANNEYPFEWNNPNGLVSDDLRSDELGSFV